MANYEGFSPSAPLSALPLTSLVEHNITPPQPDQPTHTHRRPDLSTFFSTLELIDTTNTSNSHAVPTPGDLSAAFRTLADAYNMMRQEGGSELLEALMERLYETAETPPREVKGVSDEFLAGEWNKLWFVAIGLASGRARHEA